MSKQRGRVTGPRHLCHAGPARKLSPCEDPEGTGATGELCEDGERLWAPRGEEKTTGEGAPSLTLPYQRLAWELALGTKVEKGGGPVPELVGADGVGWPGGWGGGEGGLFPHVCGGENSNYWKAGWNVLKAAGLLRLEDSPPGPGQLH